MDLGRRQAGEERVGSKKELDKEDVFN